MPNFNPDHPDDELLQDAIAAASADWEVEFCASMQTKRNTFGLNWELTEAQRDKLEEIAGYA